jgi:hypothetical protein
MGSALRRVMTMSRPPRWMLEMSSHLIARVVVPGRSPSESCSAERTSRPPSANGITTGESFGTVVTFGLRAGQFQCHQPRLRTVKIVPEREQGSGIVGQIVQGSVVSEVVPEARDCQPESVEVFAGIGDRPFVLPGGRRQCRCLPNEVIREEVVTTGTGVGGTVAESPNVTP